MNFKFKLLSSSSLAGMPSQDDQIDLKRYTNTLDWDEFTSFTSFTKMCLDYVKRRSEKSGFMQTLMRSSHELDAMIVSSGELTLELLDDALTKGVMIIETDGKEIKRISPSDINMNTDNLSIDIEQTYLHFKE